MPCPPHPAEIALSHASMASNVAHQRLEALRAAVEHAHALSEAFPDARSEAWTAIRAAEPPQQKIPAMPPSTGDMERDILECSGHRTTAELLARRLEDQLCALRTAFAAVRHEGRMPRALRNAHRAELAAHRQHREQERASVLRQLGRELERRPDATDEIERERKRVREIPLDVLLSDRRCLLRPGSRG